MRAANNSANEDTKGNTYETTLAPEWLGDLLPNDISLLQRHVRLCISLEPFLGRLPLLTPWNVDKAVDITVRSNFPVDFLWSPIISPKFLEVLYYEGFLSIGYKIEYTYRPLIVVDSKEGSHSKKGIASQRTDSRGIADIDTTHNSTSSLNDGDSSISTSNVHMVSDGTSGINDSCNTTSATTTCRIREDYCDYSTVPTTNDTDVNAGLVATPNCRSSDPTVSHVRNIYILLPKLHQQRVCLRPEEVHVSRKARKASRKMFVTIDCRFREVMYGCLKQHGESWLYPPIIEALESLYLRPSKDICRRVEIHSIEVWQLKGRGEFHLTSSSDTCGVDASDVNEVCSIDDVYKVAPVTKLPEAVIEDSYYLAAGEIGASIGGTFCSITGFTSASSAGTVQLATLGKILQNSGFSLWDLGMSLPYKLTLGGYEMTRERFIEAFRQARQQKVKLPAIPKPLKCSNFIIKP